jgi:NAD(P)H-hydrate epimerase
MAIPVLTASEMQRIDRATIDEIGMPGAVLMEQAGRACAEEAERFLPEDRPGRVAVVCGKGNNGGDGLVAARHLHHAGHQVDIFLLAHPDSLLGDALLNKHILDKLNLPLRVMASAESLRALDLSRYDVVVDAIFGTGLTSEVRGVFASAIGAINQAGVPVVAIDLPSGLSSDTGSVMGCAVEATATVSFGAPKRGHLLYPGAKLIGDLTVVDIGFPPHLFPNGPGATWLLTDEDLTPYLQQREPDAHKGDFGHLLVVAGSPDRPGAAGLCCRAACRTGAGLVTLASSREVIDRVVTASVEFMGVAVHNFEDLVGACAGKQVVALGPGLGQAPQIAMLARRAAVDLSLPMVIDADGLNNLVGQIDSLKAAKAERVLTPHPGEMARLLEIRSAEVQQDRIGACRTLATRCGCVAVLKGACTVVCDADETTFLIPTGNAGMAAGGAGDVLTGTIGALMCQGLSGLEAATVGAYLHGAAGDLATRKRGQRGQIASDLIEQLPSVIKQVEGFGEGDEDR